MLLSMTGFGNSTVECPTKKITIDIKSLNSKQLDLSARVPAGYRMLEADIRGIVQAALERGKVELNMSVESLIADTSVHINSQALAGYKKQIEDVSAHIQIDEPEDWWSILMRFPDVIKSESATDVSEEEKESTIQAVQLAVDALMDYRRTEGKKLEEFFTQRIVTISALLDEVPRYETERLIRIRSRIEEGLNSIPKVEYDKGRLEQEMIFYIEKLDINEEKQRLRQHLDYFMETLRGPKGQGKKLGFISQEMGREINTMGSKSNHAEMQILVVKMKDELEQIKEQVLNVM